ncbi:pentapeptide repeat-containing protein [Leucobacter sp. BZR 635]
MATRQLKNAPRIDPLNLHNLIDGEPGDLVAGADLDGLRFERPEVPRSLAGITLLECEVAELVTDRLELRGARMLETRLSRCSAPTVSAHGSTWRDAELLESRIGAIELSDAELRRVVIDGSKLGWVNLRGSNIQDVVFRNCSFDELDFGGAKVARVSFENCVTEKLTLTHAKSEHLDLRGLEFSAIEGFEGLRGSILGHEQVALLAETFARHFGATIQD